MQEFLIILSFVGISFIIKDLPLLDPIRNYLSSKFIFFLLLFECIACVSFHSGYITYFLYSKFKFFNFFDLLLFSFASIGLNILIERALKK